MDLKNGNITLRELMADPRAAALLRREFPQFASGPMLALGKNMTLSRILQHAGGRVPQAQLERVLEQLRTL